MPAFDATPQPEQPRKFIMSAEVVRAVTSDTNPYHEHATLPREEVERLLQKSFEHCMGRIFPELAKSQEQDITPNLAPPMQKVMRALISILRAEQGHRETLEKLAVRLILEEFKIKPGEIKFEASIVNMGGVSIAGNCCELSAEETQRTIEDPQIKEEVSKRRVINALTHGSARNYQKLVHLADETLNGISTELVKNYTDLHRGDEAGYWLARATLARLAANTPQARLGGVRIEFREGVPVIIAEAVCFSALLHELGKGVMELQSFHGLTNDPEKLSKVLAVTDTIESELWDLRYGSLFWDKTFKAINAEDGRARLHALKDFYALPAERFNFVVRELLSDSGNALVFLNGLGKKYNG